VFLTGDQDHGSYDEVARSLKLSEGAVRTAVHRLRRRYGELVRQELEGIVGDPGEVEGEIRFLLAALDHE
jgi:RNA polymerase sigma-70 factor (ECF subfamily)